MTIDIPITRGKSTRVNKEDADLAKHAWQCSLAGYAVRRVVRNKIGKTYLMHRVVLERKLGRPLEPHEVCDHINYDTLDNRRENLRLASVGESVHHTRQKGGTSKYKGVHLRKDTDKWVARITVNWKEKNLGNFPSEDDAARMYDYWAHEYFGEFAVLNFPDAIAETIKWADEYLSNPKAAILHKNNRTGYRGVYQFGGKWAARITQGVKRFFLGYFETPEDAARSYDKKAREIKGKKARVNFK